MAFIHALEWPCRLELHGPGRGDDDALERVAHPAAEAFGGANVLDLSTGSDFDVCQALWLQGADDVSIAAARLDLNRGVAVFVDEAGHQLGTFRERCLD